jgi:hypothetical protein
VTKLLSLGVRRSAFGVRRLLYSLAPALFRRRTICGYCKHYIANAGLLADNNISTGCCHACRASETRRNHFLSDHIAA